MLKIHEGIFREYDVRGIFSKELSIEDAELIGRAFGTYIRKKGEKKVVVGRDNRKSSPALHKAIIKGLLYTGVDVTDIGIVVTPIFYFATYEYNINSGIMITASHNPANYNGFKIQHGGGTLYGNELKHIEDIANNGDFEKGNGKLSCKSPVKEYMDMIKKKIKLGKKKLKVVVDCGNGTAAYFAPYILKELGCEVIPIYCESNPDFPYHFPDPTKVENLEDLINTVNINEADIGVGFDGDGDRLGVVDNKGNIIWGDMLMVLFWREILPKHPGTKAIVEVKCSDLLVKEIEKLGGNPMFYKTGHSLIKAKMKEVNAVFTGEMSGHMFFADEYYGYDDAIYAAARLLRIMSNTHENLSELLSDLPKTFVTPEIRVYCNENEKKAYVDKAKEYFKNTSFKLIEIDGVRVIFPNGWGLVRASNTAPELIVRCEGTTEGDLQYIKKEILNAILPLEVVGV